MREENLKTAATLSPELARKLALEAGFADVGITAIPHANELRDAKRYEEWIAAGRAGYMFYLERRNEAGEPVRARVKTPFPWARSAIVCWANYAYGPPASSQTPEPRSGWFARYARTSRKDERGARRPSDYHRVLLKRLRALQAGLRAECGEFEARACVDTGPLVERALAVATGLGWTGKNTCAIHPRLGSFGFLAVLLTSMRVSGLAGRQAREQAASGVIPSEAPSAVEDGAESKACPERRSQLRSESNEDLRFGFLPGKEAASEICADEDSILKGHDFSFAEQVARKNHGVLAPEGHSFELPNRCGNCTRCLDACPTGALIVAYQLDARRCVSYLTIEHKGPIAEELMEQMGRHVFGCDICQEVCPWNRKPLAADDAELAPRAELANPSLEWLGSLDAPSFERLFNGSPVRRAGFAGLRRNVAIAMGNSELVEFIPQLEPWAEEPDEGLRMAARWAIRKLRSKMNAKIK